jgi:hypothetical protein
MYIELCLGPQVALIRARGKGFASDDVTRRAAFAAQVAAGFSAQLVRAWWLRLRGQVELLLNDPSFRYTADDPDPYAFHIERFAYGADLGVAYQF